MAAFRIRSSYSQSSIGITLHIHTTKGDAANTGEVITTITTTESAATEGQRTGEYDVGV
jgi:hypothetical protein